MWCHKILVAYDGSAPSHRALEVMREIAQSNPAAEVVLVHVMRLFSSGSVVAGMDTVMVEDAMPSAGSWRLLPRSCRTLPR